MSRKLWESEPEAPAPIILAEIQESPALRGLLAPVAEAAVAMRTALDAAKASGDETARALLERIEVRDTSLIATLNEIVAAIESRTKAETPDIVVNVAPATPVQLAAPEVTVAPTIVVEPQARTWTFTHTYDGFGNIKSTKAVPSLT